MTEPQFMAVIGPILIYILGFLAVFMTVFTYFEIKEKRAKFKSQYMQQREIDPLKKENQELQELKDSEVIQKVKDWLNSNINGGDADQIDLEDDNKALLEAIDDWQSYLDTDLKSVKIA